MANKNTISRRQVMKAVGGGIGLTVGSNAFATRAKAVDSVTVRQNNRDLRGQQERCIISEDLHSALKIPINGQIRVGGQNDETKYESGLYTVTETNLESTTVEMSKDGLDRLDFTNNSSGFVDPNAPHPEYETREMADKNDEYVEILVDNEEQSDLVACAPHGGWIEYRTDAQSAYVATALDVTEWSCAGYNSGGGAYDRWHITSTAIDRRSFPKLDSIGDREFTHAVSFHGFSRSGVVIGGNADNDLKKRMRDEIDSLTNGKYDITLADSDSPYSGTSSENFVNWLTKDGDGIQIEQGWEARTTDWKTIATAVVKVYRDRVL